MERHFLFQARMLGKEQMEQHSCIEVRWPKQRLYPLPGWSLGSSGFVRSCEQSVSAASEVRALSPSPSRKPKRKRAGVPGRLLPLRLGNPWAARRAASARFASNVRSTFSAMLSSCMV